jgi:glycerol kinase
VDNQGGDLNVTDEASSVILAIDQGTTGTTVLLIDRQGEVVGRGYQEIRCAYPQPGWVEVDPLALWNRSLEAIAQALLLAPNRPIAAIGIANQRETTVLWDAATGRPVAPAIVWQCRRTADRCSDLRARGLADEIGTRTGLVIDPYFSATKLEWLLNADPERRRRAEAGQLRFGTVDTWLLWNLTGGERHFTDASNASRTMIYNIFSHQWDPTLLDLFSISPSLLPEVLNSSATFGTTVPIRLPDGSTLPGGISITGMAGDQQAALFGQACFAPGMAKCTYGTGAFLLLNNGPTAVRSRHGLLTTIAASTGSSPTYAIEGSVFVAGAAIQWLRDELGIIRAAADSEALAVSAGSNQGVYLVPAFVGLGAPYWDDRARGAIVGLTRGVGRAHLVRAALEAIAYQVRDVVDAMSADSAITAGELRIDGGAAANGFLAQFQADIIGAPVVRPRVTETTGLGAGFLAGLASGFWSSSAEISRLWRAERRFDPRLTIDERETLYAGWRRAIERVRGGG